MDESLSDFQEKRVTFTVPKKKKASKSNTLKKNKQLKGQRDIRTLVRSRKNELIEYTKDFEEVCKKSGLDVDSEQLQIAIALSKSLHESEQEHEELDDVKPLTAKERSRKIKLTLQEYGFKVPNVASKQKRRVTNKNSKLINTSESEKREKICRKYSEILEQNPALPVCGLVEYHNSDKEIYHKTTNIPYSEIRSVDEFYVPNLIEKTKHTICLLRNWSDIPGRPLSPVHEISQFQFDKFSFSQQDLDCLLSQPLQEVQEIIKSKSMKVGEENPHSDDETTDININVKYTCTTQRVCSKSPDLFDDDDYTAELHTINNTQYSETKSSAVSNKTSYLMDLTECVGHINDVQKTLPESTKLSAFETSKFVPEEPCIQAESYVCSNNYKSPVIEDTEESGRDINDFMEVTDCVSSKFEYNNIACDKNKLTMESTCVKEVIDLDIILYPQKNQLTNKGQKNVNVNVEKIENIDLTQTNDNTILDNANSNCLSPKEIVLQDCMDLTQSSNSDEDFPDVKLSSNNNKSSDDTIILDDNITNASNGNNVTLNDSLDGSQKSQDNITITGSRKYSDIINNVNHNKSGLTSYEHIYNMDLPQDSFTRNISDMNSTINLTDHNEDNTNCTSESTQSGEQSIKHEKIDLTQDTKSPDKTDSIETLGKYNNVSIDYDDLYDNIVAVSPDNIQDLENSLKNASKNIIEITDHDMQNQSVVKENKEMLNNAERYQPLNQDYKFIEEPHRTDKNFDNEFYFNNNSACEENMSMYSTDCSYLPSVKVKENLKKKVNDEVKSPTISPIKPLDVKNKPFRTPVSDQYIIKTQDVTPMLDYESMTTPARNKELEKYGIKPFKRKRAIQLLTYIYDQTHPVVEGCEIDHNIMPSTSKKFKPDQQNKEMENEQCSENMTDGHDHFKEFEIMDSDKENNLYLETKLNPDIKKIECRPDDWVFQTKEKAKIHSCRLPLHIAFHNYVSCRSSLRTAILKYEPVNIDIIHKDLITSGHRYNPKDLLKFLDKKCITVKTTENNARNKRKS